MDRDRLDLLAMGLRSIYGHEATLSRLEGALASSRFPQAALFLGAPGVGKQRLALHVAAGLLCQDGPGAPCGACDDCRHAGAVAHPDLHWFVPILRPKSGDPSKQLDEAAELIADAVAERRKSGVFPAPESLASHPLASIRLLQRVVAKTPFRGTRKVVILGNAERLVVQEASQEAANALLKVLEEPPDDTTLILTVADPHRLLPTVRSRLTPFRIPRVSDEAVKRYLQQETDPPVTGTALERLVGLSEGSIGRAAWIEADGASLADRAAGRLLSAIRAGAEDWSDVALAQAPWAARGAFSETLWALAGALRREVQELVKRGETDAARQRLRAVRRVEETLAEAAGNANPQLGVAVLARDLSGFV